MGRSSTFSPAYFLNAIITFDLHYFLPFRFTAFSLTHFCFQKTWEQGVNTDRDVEKMYVCFILRLPDAS